VALLLVIPIAARAESSPPLTLQNIASLYHPVSVTWSTGGVILSYRHNDTSTVLAKLDSNGTVQPFARSFSGKQEVYVDQSGGKGGYREGDLFLCSSDTIYRMTPDGAAVASFATPSAGSTVEYLRFDSNGAWGFLLYAVTGNGGVWSVNASGGTRLVAQLGANLMPEGLAVAPPGFGSFAGDLLITMEKSHNVVAVSRDGTTVPIVLATFPGQAPERVLVVAPDSDLLVAKYDQGTIVRIPAAEFSNYVGLPLIIMEGEAGQVGSVYVLRASGTNVTVTQLYSDPGSPHFEGAAFVPQSYLTGGAPAGTSQTSASGATGAVIGWPQVAMAAIAVILISALAFVAIRGWRKR
jgi:hypothetical protein